MKKPWTAVTDMLFPMRCVTCGSRISNSLNCLCRSCREAARSEPLRTELPDDRYWFLDGHVAAAEYDGLAKDLLHHMKFNGRKRIADPLSDMMCEAGHSLPGQFEVVTAVPMNPSKKWKRGFNQSELLAKRIARKMKIQYLPLLRERRRTGTQRELKYRDRFLNILGRYELRKQRVAYTNVLIIDDVFTTGATLNECARILKEAGAKAVWALTAARADLRDMKDGGSSGGLDGIAHDDG